MTKVLDTAIQNSSKNAHAGVNALYDGASSIRHSTKREAKAAINDLLEDFESIFTKLGPVATQEMKGLLETAKRKANAIGENVQELGNEVRQQVFKGAEATRDVVRERPFQMITIAAVAGAVLALLLNRDRR
jgi:ElaB/YqjD/DUF883 family membrane-anchored ribosome-binding protein